MTGDTEVILPPAPPPPVPNPIRPDMTLFGRSGYSYVIEDMVYDESDYRCEAIVTLANDSKFIVGITGVPEADIEKVVEDAIVANEAIHNDPVIHVRSQKPPTAAAEI